MASSSFRTALPFVLRWEGGYVNHPADHGGATNRGVTQHVYDDWRARQGKTARDVKLLEDSELEAIYESGYWLPPRCDLLGGPLDLVHFDTAVNSGPKRAVRFLQQVLGCDVDGDFGQKTKDAADACDVAAAVKEYCDAREAFYRGIVAKKPDQ